MPNRLEKNVSKAQGIFFTHECIHAMLSAPVEWLYVSIQRGVTAAIQAVSTRVH